MSSKNKANAVVKKNLFFECPTQWAFQGSRKVNINGGSALSLEISKISAGAAIAVIVGCLWTSTAIALEPTVFPGKGSRAIWNKAGKIYNQGLALANAKQTDAAIAKFEEAAAVYPYSDCTYLSLGVMYEQRKNTSKAEAAYRRATECDPKDWRNWNALATVLSDQKRYSECRDACKKALACKPPASEIQPLQKTIAEIDNHFRTHR